MFFHFCNVFYWLFDFLVSRPLLELTLMVTLRKNCKWLGKFYLDHKLQYRNKFKSTSIEIFTFSQCCCSDAENLAWVIIKCSKLSISGIFESDAKNRDTLNILFQMLYFEVMAFDSSSACKIHSKCMYIDVQSHQSFIELFKIDIIHGNLCEWFAVRVGKINSITVTAIPVPIP